MKKQEVAQNVRVTLNENWKPKSLSDEMLQLEPVIFISSNFIHTDKEDRKYVHIKGGSFFNVGIAFLEELDLEFTITEKALYGTSSISWRECVTDYLIAEKEKLEKRIFEIDQTALTRREIETSKN